MKLRVARKVSGATDTLMGAWGPIYRHRWVTRERARQRLRQAWRRWRA